LNPFRRPLIAGNWKMNAGGADALPLLAGVVEAVRAFDRVDVVVAPPFTAIAAVAQEASETKSKVGVAAQNLWFEAEGAYTGEVSSAMLKDAGAEWVIVGHSERRQIFGEGDELVAKKLARALGDGLRPIACVGETLAEREAGETLVVVERQVKALLPELSRSPGVGVIAYEPVWAIGTGRVARPEDAQEVHAHIRKLLEDVSEELAEATKILYGGSVKAENAKGLLEQPDVDGALVGGASLDATGFGRIAKAAQALADEAAEAAG